MNILPVGAGGRNILPVEAGGMNISPDFDAKAQLTACRSTHKHAMRLFPPVWTQIIFYNGITQYQTKEQRSQLIEQAHSSAIGGHKGVTKTYNRIRQKICWKNIKVLSGF